MKLSFSTLGCPDWTWGEVVSAAKDWGFDGVEVRGLQSELCAPEIEEFSAGKIETTKAQLRSLGLAIPVLASGAVLAEKDKAQDSFIEACAYIELASKLGVAYVRVMGTGQPDITAGDFKLAAGLYGRLCEYGKKLGVTPLIETNGDLASSEAMRSFLNRACCGNCGVLWDVHHTVRFGTESPLETVAALGGLIKHVHLKDSMMSGYKTVYKMMGDGDVPVAEALKLLKALRYDGFASLEWVKRWNPDLQEEPGLVFAHYKSYMDAILRTL